MIVQFKALKKMFDPETNAHRASRRGVAGPGISSGHDRSHKASVHVPISGSDNSKTPSTPSNTHADTQAAVLSQKHPLDFSVPLRMGARVFPLSQFSGFGTEKRRVEKEEKTLQHFSMRKTFACKTQSRIC